MNGSRLCSPSGRSETFTGIIEPLGNSEPSFPLTLTLSPRERAGVRGKGTFRTVRVQVIPGIVEAWESFDRTAGLPTAL
jgi:hypothetical protein